MQSTDNIENYYNVMHYDLVRIRMPHGLSNPSENKFASKGAITNGINTIFPVLNRVELALGLTATEYLCYIETIRNPYSNRETVINATLKAVQDFERGRGKCIEKMRTELAKLREIH